MCSRRIDKGGPGRASNTVTCVFFNRPGGVVLCSSVVAFWTTILKDTDSNLLKTLNFFIDNFTILKAPGSNPLNIN